MSIRYYAHSHPSQPVPGDKWQGLAVHLRAVAQLARQFAEDAMPAQSVGLSEMAYVAGLMHDLGKYDQEFQKRIQGKTTKRVPHAIHGAGFAASRGAIDAALAIAGHHAGIPSLVAVQGALQDFSIETVRQAAAEDLAELNSLVVPNVPKAFRADRLRAEVRIRLLFSCVVDADFLDTERHFDPEKTARRPSCTLDPEKRLESLRSAVDELSRRPMPDHVRDARRYVFDECLRAAKLAPGFFSLTVPTGGAKTLASMAHALQHAAHYSLRRIIYVLPYLNIIEQNAEVLRKVFGTDFVLEHHSLSDDDVHNVEGRVAKDVTTGLADEAETPHHRLATENWDAPLIVTTNVQFFDSLFANRPSKCRKLHRIARSAVILDECQTLPPALLQPILSMLQTLVSDYGTTVVFCTATQPAFRRRPGFEGGIPPDEIREMVPDNAMLFQSLQRTKAIWPRSPDQRTLWKDLASRLAAQKQVLCIVNLRRHAAELYDLVMQRVSEGVFHLSTNLCPAHRLDLLGQIRGRLQHGEPCRVVATQLVEAGVDVDFPTVFRALGPFDAIAQAAGRCNREGKLRGADGRACYGRVEVFISEDDRVPSGVYDLATKKTRALLEHSLANGQAGPDIHNPASFDDYFRRLYADTGLDAKDLQTGPDSPRRALNFPETADRFELIPQSTASVVVAYDDEARRRIGLLRRAIKRLGFPPAALMRTLQRFYVQRWPHEFAADQHEARVEPLAENCWLWSGTYDAALGIVEKEPIFDPDKWIV